MEVGQGDDALFGGCALSNEIFEKFNHHSTYSGSRFRFLLLTAVSVSDFENEWLNVIVTEISSYINFCLSVTFKGPET